jgi:protein phosphatase
MEEDAFNVINLSNQLKSLSDTLKSSASDRKLVSESDDDAEGHRADNARLAIQIDVLAGPCDKKSVSVGSEQDEISVGRAPHNTLVCFDGEVSGRHVVLRWNYQHGCWTISDQGSLNGTMLNGDRISPGMVCRLSSDDMIQLGSSTRLKILLMPEEMAISENNERRQSLSVESFPKSLTIAKGRVPSFASLLSPKLNSTSAIEASSDTLRLECGIVSCIGKDHARKKQNIEDVTSCHSPLIDDSHLYASLFCVFDGHCGVSAAEAAGTALPEEITMRVTEMVQKNANRLSEDFVKSMMRKHLHESFLATDDRIADEAGCTATAILLWNNRDNDSIQVQGANVGDSMATMILLSDEFDGSGKSIVLTEDHRLTNPKERERLEENGIPLGEDTRRLYGLNLARALGDCFLKDEDLGLSAEPSVSQVYEVSPEQGALILVASDGLWDVLSIEEAVNIASATDKDSHGGVIQIAAALAQESQDLGSRDDITVLVLRIWPREVWEDRKI